MIKSTTRRGRPTAIYKPSRGDPVVGLMRLGDGRWRASGPEKYTFSEPDEQLAILHFHHWQARRTRTSLGTVQLHSTAEDALIDMCRRAQAAGGSLQATITNAPPGTKAWAISDHTLSKEQWQWLRQQIISQPKWVAQMVGIEQIGYLMCTDATE